MQKTVFLVGILGILTGVAIIVAALATGGTGTWRSCLGGLATLGFGAYLLVKRECSLIKLAAYTIWCVVIVVALLILTHLVE